MISVLVLSYLEINKLNLRTKHLSCSSDFTNTVEGRSNWVLIENLLLFLKFKQEYKNNAILY